MPDSVVRACPPVFDPKDADRLAALRRYAILDTAPEREFDDIVQMAAQACDAPMAHINFVDADRQWIKAAVGHGAREMPLHFGFCTDAMRQDGILVLPDLAVEPELAGNPLVAGELHLRFYAGVPLLTHDGFAIGTLCVLDRAPRTLTEQQQFLLKTLARTVMAHLESRRSEMALRAREAELRLITDAMPVLIGFIDSDLVYRFANAAYETWTGRSPERVIGRGVREVVGPEIFEARRGRIERALAGEEIRFEDDWTCPDGQIRVADIWYRPRRSPAGELDGFYVFVHDITQRKRGEDLLQSRADRLAAQIELQVRDRERIWALSPVLKVIAGLDDGRIQAVNPSWTRILGWSQDETEGRRFPDFVAREESEAAARMMERLGRGLPAEDIELTCRTRDGSARKVLWTIVPEDDLVYGFGRDITDLRQAEEALRQSQKLEAIGQLTGGVAHDFNNMLTIIRSSVEFLRRPDLPDARMRRYLDAVSDTVDRAAKLTGQLLAFARRQTLTPEVFEVCARLRSIAEMLDSVTGARIRVSTELPDEACHVRADASQFETALVNMAVNARDAMNGEGTLTLHLEGGLPMPPIRGHGGSPGPFVAVAVSDTGAGITPENIGRIFEPFFTTKEVGKGTGLGLSQVIGFAKQSGGDVAVRSDPGVGTTFTLYLPEVAAPRRNGRRDQTNDPSSGCEGDLRILVVEDNLEVGRFCAQILTDLGHHPVRTENAEAALAEVERAPARFDAVFSDVVMPGIGGIELARRLRASYPDLPVVLTSGYSHVLARDDTHGFQVLRKPYSAEELSRVLRQATRARRRPVGDAT